MTLGGESTRRALVVTLGCKLNFAESASIQRELARLGYNHMDDDAPASHPEVIVVNTCSVTAEADKKGRQTIRKLNRRYPEAAIIVTGCFAQLRPDEVAALPGVVLVAGNDRKDLIAEYLMQWQTDRETRCLVTPAKEIRRFTPSCDAGERTRWFLKVQDGCDYWCSYCTIPRARGRSRSPRISDLVSQAHNVAAQGGREIVLTGVNIGDFGKGSDETFLDLCRALDQVEGIDRYRISSIEPNLLTDDLIRWTANDSRAFMPHFHIPLQSGSDPVLKLMRRHYDTALFRKKVELVRSLMPDAFIGVDVIVGARGETPDLFEQSLEYVGSLPVSRLHVFTYSERPDTAALAITPVVSQEEKHQRTRRMMEVSDRHLDAFAQSMTGTVRPVLVEHNHRGHTDNYLPVEVIADVPPNSLLNVRLHNLRGNGDNIIFEGFPV